MVHRAGGGKVDAGSIAVGLIGVVLSLQVVTTSYLIKHERRISKIEGDLYVNSRNPTDYPITLQIADLMKDVSYIKEKVEKIEQVIKELHRKF